MQVRDSKGHILAQKDGITKGKFTFVTETYDTFEVCFISKVPQGLYFFNIVDYLAIIIRIFNYILILNPIQIYYIYYYSM